VNCRKVTHLLSAYMDGELPGVEHRQIHDHLVRCSDCRIEYNDLLRMKRLLGRLRMCEASPDLPGAIFQYIDRQSAAGKERATAAWLQTLLSRLQTSVTVPHAVGVGLGVVLVAFLYSAQLNSVANVQNASIAASGWDTPPTVTEFTNGVNYPNSQRFLSRVSANSVSGPGRDDLFPLLPDQGGLHRRTSTPIDPLVWRTH